MNLVRFLIIICDAFSCLTKDKGKKYANKTGLLGNLACIKIHAGFTVLIERCLNDEPMSNSNFYVCKCVNVCKKKKKRVLMCFDISLSELKKYFTVT